MGKRNIGITLSYVNTFVTMICGFILSSVSLRSSGDVEYGLYQTIASFATYLVMLEFGTGSAMSRGIIIYKNSNKMERVQNCISTIWYMTVLLASIIVVVASVFYINIGRIYRVTMSEDQIIYAKKMFLVITLYLVVNYFRQALNGILLGMEQYSFASAISTISTIFRTITLVVLMLFLPYGMTIACVDAILSITVFAITFFYCKKKYQIKFRLQYFDKNIVVEFTPLCFALLIQAFVNQANNSVDKFVIGIQMDMVSVAIYSVAQYIYSIFASVTTIPISMYLPQVGKDIANGLEGKALTDTFVQPCRFVTLLGGSILFGFLAVGRQFISFFYGSTKEQAWLYALIIIIPMFVNMTNGILVNVLDIRNKRQVRSFALMATTILNIGMTIWFISMWGIIGAVIATAIATLLGQIVFMNIYYERKMNIKVRYLFAKAYQGILPYQLLAAMISFFVTNRIEHNLLAFFIGGIIFVAVSGGLILLFGLNDYEKKLFGAFMLKYKKHKKLN